jgi:hypothetical protein
VYEVIGLVGAGTRFLARRLDEVGRLAQNQLHVIVNWPALLK